MPKRTKDVNKPVKLLAFGEILWDMLPSGKKMGGAPVNFLYHAQTAGADVRALTRVGKDELGDEILENVRRLNLSTELIQTDPTAPTGVVEVALDEKGTPSYQIVKKVAWDNIATENETLEKVKEFFADPSVPSAFCFGTLALRSSNNKSAIVRLMEALPRHVKLFADLNFRAPFYAYETTDFSVGVSDFVKLSVEEALELNRLLPPVFLFKSDVEALNDPKVREELAASDSDDHEVKGAFREWATSLQKERNAGTIILTCGENGAFIFDRKKTYYEPAVPVAVKDTVGAGDAFAALCLVGLLRGVDYKTILKAAAKRAAFVCAQNGGTPIIPKKLLAPFGA